MTNPALSPEVIKEKALRNWSETKDSYKSDIKRDMTWKKARYGGFPYQHRRPLPRTTWVKAIRYIDAIVKKYPVQLRFVMALPLWGRFAEEWCNTGSEAKAMKAI